MKKKVEFFVTNCKIVKFGRYLTRPIFEVPDNFVKKGELVEVDLRLVFESSGNTFKIEAELIKDTICSKAMKGLKELIFEVPDNFDKKEYSNNDIILFNQWYEKNKCSFHLDVKAALVYWKKEVKY